MDAPVISQRLKTWMVSALALALAVAVGWNIGSSNYQTLALVFVTTAGAAIWLFTGRFFWVLAIASSFLAGTFPILGGAFTPFQILMVMGLAKFIVEDLILRRTTMMAKRRFDVLMIAGFMGILTFHAMRDRFGMRLLGSNVWGGHNYVNVYVGLAAFLVVQSIPIKPKGWAKLPYVVLAVTGFDLFIAIITTIFPSSIYKIFPFYSAVSILSLEEAISGTSDITGRLGAFGNFGVVLIVIVLATVSLRRILDPRKLLYLLALVVGFGATLFSGYRSAVINALIAFLLAGIRDLKVRVIVLFPILAIVLLAFSVVNSQVFHLPKQIQRGLAFLPGDWDADMAQDALSSNNFRKEIWTLWAKTYFPAHPWLGRGFGFKSDWSKMSIVYNQKAEESQMVETGNIHNGLLAALDTFGIIGTIFLVIWNLHLLTRTFAVSFRRGDEAGAALRFLALYLAVLIISYWFGALTVGTFLPQEFALAGVFLQLQRIMSAEAVAAQAAVPLSADYREGLAPV